MTVRYEAEDLVTDQGFPMERVDTGRPHPARMYDYFLGGRDNYEVDRVAAQQIMDAAPDVVTGARANRDFLRRAVRFLAGRGVRQIIDIGTGIPTSPNTHEIAHAVSKDVRVAYVDNDPIVGAHAGARLLGDRHTGFLLADLRDPAAILEHPTISRLIDLDQPVALLLVSVLHFVRDDEDPYGLVAAYRDALPSGSYLAVSHGTADFHRDKVEAVAEIYRDKSVTAGFTARSHSEVLGFLDGFELLEPGLVQVSLWHPDAEPDPNEVVRTGVYGAVGRKP
jgi:hypothetical protein